MKKNNGFCLFVFALLISAAQASERTCHGRPLVFLGGINGFEKLADPAASENLRATGCAGLYLHAIAAQEQLRDGRLKEIETTWREAANPVAEFGVPVKAIDFNGAHYVETSVWPFMWGMGFSIRSANVNINDGNFGEGTYSSFDERNLAAFLSLERALTSKSVLSIRPVISPNGGREPISDWNDEFWNKARSAAVAGRGIALDTPPSYALSRGEQYIAFAAQQIKWANELGLDTAVILSPYPTVRAKLIAPARAGVSKVITNSQRFTANLELSGKCVAPGTVVVRVQNEYVELSNSLQCDLEPGEAIFGAEIFRKSTEIYVNRLQSLGAVPREWDVENYTRGKGNVIGPEAEPNSMAGVALWLAQNSPIVKSERKNR